MKFATLVLLSSLSLSTSVYGQEPELVCSVSSKTIDQIQSLSVTVQGDVTSVSVSYPGLPTNLIRTASTQFRDGKVELRVDDSNSPFVYYTYLEKMPDGKWALTKYFYCDFAYFEEEACAGTFVLKDSAKLNCQ